MALQFFEIEKGLAIDGQLSLLVGSGAPGTTADTDAALKGASYQDITNGDTFTKKLDGTGADKWRINATQEYVNSSIANSVSWREPVAVRDNVATTLVALKADLDADDLIQGVAVTVGMRILASAISPGNKNVYIVGGVSLNWTLTEDANLATTGDALFVVGGTDAGRKFTFNGTIWIWNDQTSEDELGYIRTFIGKAAGNDVPVYSSVTQITQNSNLEAAIGALDASIGTDPITGEVIVSTATVNANIKSLDNHIALNQHKASATNVTTQVVIDSIDKTLVDTVKWIVYATDTGTSVRKRASEIYAMHNGTTATFTKYANLNIGVNITGLTYDVVINGANIELLVSSTLAANVEVRRVAVV